MINTSRILGVAIVSCLAGCATPTPVNQMKVDRRFVSSQANASRMAKFLYPAIIVAIDGKPYSNSENAELLLLPPGVHALIVKMAISSGGTYSTTLSLNYPVGFRHDFRRGVIYGCNLYQRNSVAYVNLLEFPSGEAANGVVVANIASGNIQR